MQTTDVTTDNNNIIIKKVKRRRRKPIKSCTFCRQRKLKCDQKRPICSSCKSRNLYNCTYSVMLSPSPPPPPPQQQQQNTNMTSPIINTNETTIHASSSFSSSSSSPKSAVDANELLLKVESLEKQINEMKNNSIDNQNLNIHTVHDSNTYVPSTITPNKQTLDIHHPNEDENVFQNLNQHLPNPLNDYYFLQCKASGRRIMYGATSMRTHLYRHWSGFGHKFNQLWAKIKFERNKWKIAHNVSNSTELQLIETTIDPNFTTLLAKLTHDLPPYNKCIEIIHNFFDSSYKDLYLINSTLDKYKVMNDFYTYVIPDSENLLPNGDKPIKSILAGSKKNYYKVAVIVQIIALRFFYLNCPESLDIFFLYLLGQISSKVFFIERLQFMLLRYYYLKIYKSDCDSSNVINIVSTMVSTAISMGLDRDINTIYKDQEHVVGNLKSIHNLWQLIVFLDLECSFQTGRPLLLFDIDLDHLNFDDITCEDPQLTKLMRMTKMGRRVLMCINSKYGIPKFQSLVEHIIEFMERELPPISLFVDSQKLAQVNLNNVRLVSFCLELILCLNALNSAIDKKVCIKIKNNSIHISLLAFHVLQAVTDRCFQLDKEHFPEMFTQTSSNLTPYFAQAIGFAAGLLPRVSTIFSSILYYRLTVFANNDFIFYNQKHNNWKPNTLRIDNKTISVLDVIDILNKISDKWLSPDDPLKRKIMSNSYFFMVANAMHFTFRQVLVKCMQYRKLTEDAWITQLDGSMKSRSETYLNDSRTDNLQDIMNENLIRNESITKGVCPISMIVNSQQIQMNSGGNNCPEHQKTYVSTDNKVDFSKNNSINYADPVSPKHNDEEKTMKNNVEIDNQKRIEDKESALLQQITDEFWTNYNTGWEELLSQTDVHELFENYL